MRVLVAARAFDSCGRELKCNFPSRANDSSREIAQWKIFIAFHEPFLFSLFLSLSLSLSFFAPLSFFVSLSLFSYSPSFSVLHFVSFFLREPGEYQLESFRGTVPLFQFLGPEFNLRAMQR